MEWRLPSIETVMRAMESVFTPLMVVLLLMCGGLLWLTRGSTLADRRLDREARLATVGGWVYLVLAITGYLAPRVYFLLIY